MREPEVLTMLGISRSTFRRLMEKGVIPQPLRPSEGIRRWQHHEICDLILKWATERGQRPVHLSAIEEKAELSRKRIRHSATERRKPRIKRSA